jgi:NADH-ubiquinone oxidoreductase chain 6
MLFTINETFTNGSSYNLINSISIIAILCGILVVIIKNPIVSVLFLIGLFFSIANYLMTLGMGFIGLSYLLVYVGAVSILFLFILMLINVRTSELTSNSTNSIPLALYIGILFTITLGRVLPHNIPTTSQENTSELHAEYNVIGTYNLERKSELFLVTSNT